MSSTPGNDPLPDNHSNVYFLVPLTAVVVLGLLAFWIQRRRTLRKSGRRRPHIYAIDATGRRILERDLENAWVQGATRRSTILAGGGLGAAPYPGLRQGHASTNHNHNYNNNNNGGGPAGTTTGRRTRPSNRWAWIQNARLPEEGLNELGEAPPPYDRRKKHEQGKHEVVVEMQSPQSVPEDRCAGPSTDGGSREPPPPPPAGPDGEAPAYEEGARSPGTAAGEVASFAVMPPPPGYEAAGETETITRPSPAYVAVATSRRST